ncbi:MAG: Glycosyl transferase, family 39 [Candidatus Curtissbacteria bacterium GW2011_GWA1_40_9]|uniref:Glycosyl transferase, family 39 n=1 Tax=Candidatus Curtissbacteria bacterium GW2011_GWA1_40_9 TaxID=1618408 RepID=A0A0G0WS38_9BACT|nr:MAG: Glycosyl transferase, family 39 [Candidatus Curtissbacteria bacterium GW2011_GWA1_40_9]
MKKLIAQLERHHILVFIILFITFLFRFPSLFEPYWYGDEGIFAAVAKNLTQGGVLYQTAWDNKPPMIYLTYAGIFSLFGVSMFWLRLVVAVVVMTTATVIYEIGRETIGKHRALVASFIFGFFTSLRIIEGNLALTEIFMILPISCAMYLALKGKFDNYSLFFAGALFAIASLYKQVGAFEALALGIYIFLIRDKFSDFFKKGLVLILGFSIPFAVTFAYFLKHGIVNEFIFGAYTYYSIYLGESPKYAELINISKFLPAIAVILYGFYKKFKAVKVNYIHLFLLWIAFSFMGAYFSGRTYGHYLVQVTPGVSLLLASISLAKVRINIARFVFSCLFLIPLLFLTSLIFRDFISGGPINQIKWWGNFIDFATGNKSETEYNNYFDGNVNTIMALTDALKVNSAYGESIYIWGDLPWLYAIVDGKNPSRYVTSFHVFGVPSEIGRLEVARDLNAKSPKYIVKPQGSIGYFAELENLLIRKYTHIAKINEADLYILR